MRLMLATTLLLCVAPATLVAQQEDREREARRFIAEYERAVATRDIAFLERVMPDEYVRSGPGGTMIDREKTLRYFRQERERPSYRSIALEHPNMKVRVIGSVALVTNDWISTTAPLDSAKTTPATYRGRYTGVFEKRDGRWLVLAEHDSEQVLDESWMVAEVEKARREYLALVVRLQGERAVGAPSRTDDLRAIEHMLADDYTGTDAEGEVANKRVALERLRGDRVVRTSMDVVEQQIRAIGNGVVIETARVRQGGTNGAASFAAMWRYTTTWGFHDGRWQIIADHASGVEK